MSAEKTASHHAAAWLMRTGAAIAIGGGGVLGLQAAENYHAEHAPAHNAATATQAREAAGVAADIALAGLIPLTVGGGLRLAQQRQTV